tara:strand:- start:1030 stop:1347 length:318 start_codon:yes stop_codon:yes gene_type:complete
MLCWLASLVSLAFTVRLRGPFPVQPGTGLAIRDAISTGLKKSVIDVVHVDVQGSRLFYDEVAVYQTVFFRNGTRADASARGPNVLSAVRQAAAGLSWPPIPGAPP